MELVDWQSKREKLMHTEFKNIYVPSISLYLNTEFKKTCLSGLKKELCEWERYKVDIKEILYLFEKCMSPKNLLATTFVRDKKFIENITHTIWKSRYEITDLIKDVNSELEKTDIYYKSLNNLLNAKVKQIENIQVSLIKFYNQCVDLYNKTTNLHYEVMFI